MKLIKDVSAEKIRGGFYTPEVIATFILKWAINNNSINGDILEPSCGDGIFIKQIKKYKYNYKSLTGVELDKIEAQKSSDIILKNYNIINEDFHKYCNNTKDRFDIIIGNPPYIRYQYFNEEQRNEAIKIFNKSDLKYSKLTNAWVSFVIGSSQLLKENGKIGFVLPAEILQVSYAKQLREFLAKFYNKINIISFEKLVFPNIQQEVVLLLCEKNQSNTHLIEHLELKDASELEKLDINKIKSPSKKINISANKWTYYFLDQEEIDFLEKIKLKFNNIKCFAKNEVGITTGKNEYFTINKNIVDEYNLTDYAKPLMGRSIQLNGLNFSETDWEKNVQLNAKAFLLVFPDKEIIMQENKRAYNYIEYGENLKYNLGYKCKIRGSEWQKVPSLKISEIFFTRQIHLYPKMVLNEAKAYTTDTVHRVYLKKDINEKAFVVSFYNSLSFAFAEIVGRSYGGGVLELMPSEVEEILIPYKIENEEIFSIVNKMIRDNINIDEILEYTDNFLLRETYGLSNDEIKLSKRIWKKLSNRRLGRK